MIWFWLALSTAFLGASIAAVIGSKLGAAGISPFMIMAMNSLLTLPAYWIMAMKTTDMKAEWRQVVDGRLLPWVLGLGVLYVVYNTAFYYALKYGSATQVGMVQLSTPLFIGLIAWLVFGQQQFTASNLIGWSLIVAGVGCIYWFRA